MAQINGARLPAKAKCALDNNAGTRDGAKWQDHAEEVKLQKQDAPLLNKTGMRLGATWQWTQVALACSLGRGTDGAT